MADDEYIAFNLYHLKVRTLERLLEEHPNNPSVRKGIYRILEALNNEDFKMNAKLREFLGMGLYGTVFSGGLLQAGALYFAKFPLLSQERSKDWNERNMEKQATVYERELAIGKSLGELNRPSFSTNYRIVSNLSPPLIVGREEPLTPLASHEFGLVPHGNILIGQYISGKTLADSLNSLDVKTVLKIFTLIVNDLGRTPSFTHGDLHLNNIIVHRVPQPYSFQMTSFQPHWLETNTYGVLIDYGQARFDGIAYQKPEFFLGTEFHIELYDIYHLMMNLLAESSLRLFEGLKFLVRYFYRGAKRIDRNFIAMKQRDINEANRKRFLISSEFHRRTFADFSNWLYQQDEIKDILSDVPHHRKWEMFEEVDFWGEIGINPLEPMPIISPLQWILFEDVPFQERFSKQLLDEEENIYHELEIIVGREDFETSFNKRRLEEKLFETFRVAYLVARLRQTRRYLEDIGYVETQKPLILTNFHNTFIEQKEFLGFFIRSLPNRI